MGLDFKHTCPDINRSISDVKNTIHYFLTEFYDIIKNIEEEDKELIISESSENLYNDIESLFEDVRKLNEDMRDTADKQIDDLEEKVSELNERVKELDNEVYELEYKIKYETHD